MKKLAVCLAIASSFPATLACASNVGVNVGINIGASPAVVVPAPPPPVYHASPVIIEEPPLFLEPPELGFHVAVGIPYNMFFVGSTYYLYRGNAWYMAPHYNGPWAVTRYQSLPPKLRRYPFEKIRYYRDEGYRDYSQTHRPYWGSHQFRPEKEWKKEQKEQRKRIKEARKEERKEMKEHWKREREEYPYGRHHGHGD